MANFVEYQPTALNRFAVHKMTTRIKAEEELWNKVCDELFSLDTLVARDKELRNLSRYVKDVFGLKIVVGKPEDAQELQETLSALNFQPASSTGWERPRPKLPSPELHGSEKLSHRWAQQTKWLGSSEISRQVVGWTL